MAKLVVSFARAPRVFCRSPAANPNSLPPLTQTLPSPSLDRALDRALDRVIDRAAEQSSITALRSAPGNPLE
ncbi:MAG: hypothetical protein ACO4AI_16700 [Prochlorothrix sp.]